MATLYIVKQGDCLATIAAEHGFASWRTLYYTPENAEFRKLRPDPNVLYPGDKLLIPERDGRKEPCGTAQKHRFQVTTPGIMLRLALRDRKGQALAGKKYRLRVDGMEERTGTTRSDGMLIERLRSNARIGSLDLWLDSAADRPAFRWRLSLGALDPIETLSGVQARLNNLNFKVGPIDGVAGPSTMAAVKAFQREFGLVVDGIAGPQTQAKLKELHGW